MHGPHTGAAVDRFVTFIALHVRPPSKDDSTVSARRADPRG
ncbi:hypothetical protein YW7DRAFT_03795 [Streptomyces sp. AmelKG-E11A]|nr:hypothetical protein [Streptomyces sp. SID4919]SCK43277.1 hypothetical protein YW7DRAFT_03795 [Streptomyces sp. AmelKG-E11A]